MQPAHDPATRTSGKESKRTTNMKQIKCPFMKSPYARFFDGVSMRTFTLSTFDGLFILIIKLSTFNNKYEKAVCM
jgi:hypothetical protein